MLRRVACRGAGYCGIVQGGVSVVGEVSGFQTGIGLMKHKSVYPEGFCIASSSVSDWLLVQ